MRDFDAGLTLFDSAQAFHWRPIGDEFVAVVNGHIMTAADDDDFARDYFDDFRDYTKLIDECADFPIAKKAVEMLKGLRVLNQPTWEALIAFILSANNNVPRIRSLVYACSREYGEAYEYKGEILYGFPSPEKLASADEAEMQRITRCGYRARYLIQTARSVCDGFPLDEIKNMPFDEARRMLMTLMGVGGKVADCVLLFGCRFSQAFPVDVWVERLMNKWFSVEGSREHIRREAVRLLGNNCGLIQQALFHAARTGLIEL